MSIIQITPAYGRDYSSKQKAVAAFNAEKDFRVVDVGCKYNGSYVNKQQLVGEYDEVKIRYNKLTRVAIVPLV